MIVYKQRLITAFGVTVYLRKAEFLLATGALQEGCKGRTDSFSFHSDRFILSYKILVLCPIPSTQKNAVQLFAPVLRRINSDKEKKR